jgi:hypothetical protein
VTNTTNLLSRLWPVALYAAVVSLMVLNWQRDPFDPTLTGTASYGHNHDGALAEMALWALAELVVLHLVLAPGAPAAGTWRAVAALLGFGVWTLFSLMITMHAGGIVALHALWLMAVDLGIVVVLIARARRRLVG